MSRDTFGLIVMAILIVMALGIVYTSTDDPAAAYNPGGGWNHAWVGAVAVGLAAPLILSTFGGKRSGCAVVLGVMFLGAVAYYMFIVRGW